MKKLDRCPKALSFYKSWDTDSASLAHCVVVGSFLRTSFQIVKKNSIKFKKLKVYQFILYYTHSDILNISTRRGDSNGKNKNYQINYIQKYILNDKDDKNTNIGQKQILRVN